MIARMTCLHKLSRKTYQKKRCWVHVLLNIDPLCQLKMKNKRKRGYPLEVQRRLRASIQRSHP